MRPSIYVQTNKGQILIDASPDFRQQFLQFSNGNIPQAVLITHLHNDHIAGLGDFADLCFWRRHPACIFSPEEMIAGLRRKFAHLTPARGIDMLATKQTQLYDWLVSFHPVQHGANGYSYAIRFSNSKMVWAYMPDAFQVTEEQFDALRDLDLLIMGAAYWKENAEPRQRSIYDVQEALVIKQTLSVKRLILTHLSHDIDVPRYAAALQENVAFAFDGMEIPL